MRVWILVSSFQDITCRIINLVNNSKVLMHDMQKSLLQIWVLDRGSGDDF